jgi:hypothetical protein
MSDAGLERAFEEGAAAARRGEEAAPGCTTTPEGRAWLRGYIAAAGENAPVPPPSE